MISQSLTIQTTTGENMSTRVDDVSERFRYVKSLDVIRGLAVIFVLFLHGSYGFFKGGWVGVDLFFVLSGYLITSLLLNEYRVSRKINIARFYVRRALRLFPPLIICVIISNFLWSFTALYPEANEKVATIAALFYFTNLIPGNVSGNMAHLWSLAVEEHFYLFWPVLTTLIFFRISLKWGISILLILISGISLFRIFAFNHYLQFGNGVIVINPYFFTFCRIDTILIGAMLAIFLNRPGFKNVPMTDKKATIFLLALFCIFGVIVFSISNSNSLLSKGGFIGTDIACALLILVAIKSPDHFLLSNKILRWIGIRSYGIYAYHFPIFLALEGLRKHHSIGNFLIVTLLRCGITVLIATLSYRYIELPALRFKKRYEVAKIANAF